MASSSSRPSVVRARVRSTGRRTSRAEPSVRCHERRAAPPTPSACSRRRSITASRSPTAPCATCGSARARTSRARVARANDWYEGGGSATEKAVAEIVVYPPTRGAADPGRSVRAGEDRRARRHGPRPAARRLDRPDDPRDRGRAQRRRVGPQPGRDRHVRRARAAARELPQADRRATSGSSSRAASSSSAR